MGAAILAAGLGGSQERDGGRRPAGAAAAGGLPAEYAQLFASQEEWFRAASAKRGDMYAHLQAEAFDLQRYLLEAESKASALVARTSELEALVRDERERWAAETAAAAAASGVGVGGGSVSLSRRA